MNEQQASSANDVVKTRVVKIGDVPFGGEKLQVIAGPCSIESESQFRKSIEGCRSSGATVLRGGIFKMRSDPKSFQGLGIQDARFARDLCREFKMPLLSEVTDPRQIESLGDMVDAFQVGTRNMFNYSLLQELGRQKKPVLLKRGFSALLDELLMASEYIVREGNENVLLCERGIRTFERATRNTLDLSAIPYLKERSHFPVIVDPSHGVGISRFVSPMALAAVAAGADGLLIEVHPSPKDALSDGAQALDFGTFSKLMKDAAKLSACMGRPAAWT